MEVNLKACKKSNGSEGNHFSLLVCHLNIWTFVEFIEMECIRSDMRLICHTLDYCARCIQNELFLWAYHHFLLICESRDVGLLQCYMKCNLFKTKLQKLNQTHFMYVSLKLIASWIFRFICSSYAWLCVYLCFVEWVGWSIMLFFVSFTNFSFLYFSTSSNQSTCMLETFSVWFSFGVLFVGLDRVHVS